MYKTYLVKATYQDDGETTFREYAHDMNPKEWESWMESESDGLCKYKTIKEIKPQNQNNMYAQKSFSRSAYKDYGNRNSGNFQNYKMAPKDSKKHSGCSMKKYVPQEGPNKGHNQTIVNGWMYRKQTGLVKYKAITTQKSKDTGKGWAGHIAVSVIAPNGQKAFYWGTMELKTGKTVIRDLGIVMSPKGGRGGYVGSFTQK